MDLRTFEGMQAVADAAVKRNGGMVTPAVIGAVLDAWWAASPLGAEPKVMTTAEWSPAVGTAVVIDGAGTLAVAFA